MRLTSPAFAEGGVIPRRHTCDGEDLSPPLVIEDVPAGAASLTLVVDDPDAPRERPWVHWLLWNLPPDVGKLQEGYPPGTKAPPILGAVQGRNHFPEDNLRYRGPCPPPGHGAHHYRFALHALGTVLALEEGATRRMLEDAMEGHVLATATLTGTYARGESAARP